MSKWGPAHPESRTETARMALRRYVALLCMPCMACSLKPGGKYPYLNSKSIGPNGLDRRASSSFGPSTVIGRGDWDAFEVRSGGLYSNQFLIRIAQSIALSIHDRFIQRKNFSINQAAGLLERSALNFGVVGRDKFVFFD